MSFSQRYYGDREDLRQRPNEAFLPPLSISINRKFDQLPVSSSLVAAVAIENKFDGRHFDIFDQPPKDEILAKIFIGKKVFIRVLVEFL